MESHLRVVPPEPAPEASPLGAARIRRRLTVEEVAARTGLTADEVEALEESRVYRFPSVSEALAATLLVATTLGITEREARGIAELHGGRRRRFPRARLLAALAFAAVFATLGWFVALPEVRGHESATPAPAVAQKPLPPPWEIRVDVFNGTEVANAATLLANEIGGPLAYKLGTVENADRLDYVETRVYYTPGGERIAERLAQELGVAMTALPSAGGDENRLVVIVGQDRAGS
jgi:transcriptional regulator with XRE-family HTH domain